MAIDWRYFVSAPLDQYFVDKDTGLPLADGTLTFYKDNSRSTEKPVYQLTGSPPNYTFTALPNPIELSSVGTIQNDDGDNVVIYYYPFDAEGNVELYYVECESSEEVPQWQREAWPPNISQESQLQDESLVQNQLSNPQFTHVFINDIDPTVFTVSAATDEVFSFAPNWDFVISGTGTVTVERIAIPGNDKVITSPPYVVDVIVSAGITSCYLRQRFYNNSGLWASTPTQDIYLSAAFVARNENTGVSSLEIFYDESSGGSPVSILNGDFDNSDYSLVTGTTTNPMPLSTNTDSGNDGYIDIYISFLTNSHVRLSSLQIVPTLSEELGALIKYDQQSSKREESFLGDYYLPRLNIRPTASLLIGWDFPLNPTQFGNSGTIGTNAAYIWDQTIAGRATGSSVSYARDSITSGLSFTSGGTNNACFILQYLTGSDAKKILGNRLSVNINGYQEDGTTPVKMRVYLYRGSSAANIPTLSNTIGTITSDGVFTLTAANWTLIPRSGLDTATANFNTVSDNSDINHNNNYGFNGWEIIDDAQIGDTDKFAIVVTFVFVENSTFFTVNSISCTLGDIPSLPAPQPFDEVLRECQFFYEKSYNTTTLPGTVEESNSLLRQMIISPASQSTSSTARTLHAASFGFTYFTVKRSTTPTITLYGTRSGATSAQVSAVIYNAGAEIAHANVSSTNWSVTNRGDKAVQFHATTVTALLTSGVVTGDFADAFIEFHYTVDARLGIV